MSIKNLGHYINKHSVDLASKKLADPISTSQTWTRNIFWPPISASANSIVGLYAIWPGGGNFFAFTGAGDYTIDYGNGVTTNYSSGSTAYYEYDYNAVALDGTDISIEYEEGTSTFYHSANYIENGTILKFYNNVDLISGIKLDHPYYVVNSDAAAFQVSETLGGSPITFIGNGFLTLLPYKLVTVTITPQAGQNLTSANFFVKHNQAGLVDRYCTGWLELIINCPNLTSLTISQNSSVVVNHNILENVILTNIGSVTSLAGLMRLHCYNLKNFELNHISNSVTDTNNMFNACQSLLSVKLLGTNNVTDMTSMFSSCVALVSIPLFDTSAALNMNSMFTSCGSLKEIPLLNTANVTNMSIMFASCTSLKTIPLLNTSSVTNMSNMFSSCSSLTNVPLLNTSSVTNMSNMFSSCPSLTSVPLFNTANVTDASSMFAYCSSIKNIPLFNLSNATNIASMFINCFSLRSVPLFNTVSATNMASMFSGCVSLISVPVFNTALVTSMSGMFNSCRSLINIPFLNTSSVQNMSSMFTNCISMTTVPLFNTSNVTNMSSMFNTCTCLRSIPLFDTSNVTSFGSMFSSCLALSYVPALNVTAVTTSSNFSNMFNLCRSLCRIEAEDFRFTFSVANCKLSATELNAIYTRLPTVTGQTITVTGNYGTASDNPSIATAKGWTVTG